MNKEDNLKEKFKQALISTIKVISDDFKIEKEKNLSSKNYNFFELDNLSTREDYIKLRAETDSEALKRKFSDKNIYQKNIPHNSSCRLLYDISEKIRYEMLGTKMLKGISKNLKDNYSHKIILKRKDQLKSKDNVKIAEAFELYMLKNFLGIKLNSLSKKILSFWEKDFQSSFDEHLSYLNNNLENQEVYNSKFSEILQQMEIFNSENDDEKQDKQENENNNNNNQDNQNQTQGEDEKKQQDKDQNGLDADYDLNEFRMDEQLVETKNIIFLLLSLMRLQKLKHWKLQKKF
jgi:cobaltochelatase CobT